MIRHFISRQFLIFLLTGGVAAGVNFGSRILYSNWLSFSAAIVLAYLTGMATAFALAKLFVFRESTQTMGKSAGFFVLVNAIAIVQTWAVSMLMLQIVLPWMNVARYAPELAHAVGVIVPVFTSYLGHKHWSFRG